MKNDLVIFDLSQNIRGLTEIFYTDLFREFWDIQRLLNEGYTEFEFGISIGIEA
jgi:hypothetical protein